MMMMMIYIYIFTPLTVNMFYFYLKKLVGKNLPPIFSGQKLISLDKFCLSCKYLIIIFLFLFIMSKV